MDHIWLSRALGDRQGEHQGGIEKRPGGLTHPDALPGSPSLVRGADQGVKAPPRPAVDHRERLDAPPGSGAVRLLAPAGRAPARDG
jgi:hypothetical protein